MKTTSIKIVLSIVMAAVLLTTSGCWTSQGNQPGGSGRAGGSMGSSDRPNKADDGIASAQTGKRSTDGDLIPAGTP